MKRCIEKDHGHRRNPANVLSLSGTMDHAGQPGSSFRMIIRQRPPPTRSKGIWDEESWAPQKPLKTFNSRKLERSGDPRCISLPQSGRTLDVTPSVVVIPLLASRAGNYGDSETNTINAAVLWRPKASEIPWKPSHDGNTSATARRTSENRGGNGMGLRGARGRYPYRTNKCTEPIYCLEGIR